jgi:hypothetical protein
MSFEKRNSNMATSRLIPDESDRKVTKHEAARKLAQLIEADMDRKGLSEDKRNDRVKRFVEHVDAVSAGRAK